MPDDNDAPAARTPGQAAYEAYMQPERFSHPRLGQRVATWAEIAHMDGEQALWEAVAQAAIAARAPAEAQPEGLRAALQREERNHRRTIDQRDAAEEALSLAHALVMGEVPEWSNLYGYREALGAMEDRLALSTPPAPQSSQDLREAAQRVVDAADYVEREGVFLAPRHPAITDLRTALSAPPREEERLAAQVASADAQIRAGLKPVCPDCGVPVDECCASTPPKEAETFIDHKRPINVELRDAGALREQMACIIINRVMHDAKTLRTVDERGLDAADAILKLFSAPPQFAADRVREALDCADHYIDGLRRLWQRGVMRDLAEAEACYISAKTAALSALEAAQ